MKTKENKKIGEWKELMAQELAETFKKGKHLYISGYLGLKADEINELRRLLEPSGSSYLVVKNALARIALERAGLKELVQHVKDDTGVVLGGGDPVASAKAIARFGKSRESVKVRGGYLDGQAIDAERVMYLASLPSRQELIAKVVFGIKSPISGFVGVLSNTLKGFLYVIEAIRSKKGG